MLFSHAVRLKVIVFNLQRVKPGVGAGYFYEGHKTHPLTCNPQETCQKTGQFSKSRRKIQFSVFQFCKNRR